MKTAPESLPESGMEVLCTYPRQVEYSTFRNQKQAGPFGHYLYGGATCTLKKEKMVISSAKSIEVVMANGTPRVSLQTRIMPNQELKLAIFLIRKLKNPYLLQKELGYQDLSKYIVTVHPQQKGLLLITNSLSEKSLNFQEILLFLI